MTARAVHWHEGMFLSPHHFQAAERHWAARGQADEKWDHHYNWGTRSIELDRDALSNHRLVVRRLRARLRDGTIVSVPEDGSLPERDLRPAFAQTAGVTAFLAIPVARLGQANVTEDGGTDRGRYLLETQDLEDENDGLNPQPLQFRRLNLRLLLSTEDRGGFEVLELARLEKSADADAAPRLDASYIPPVLACDSSETLQVGILQSLYDRIGKKLDLLANQVETRGIGIEGQSAGDALIVGQLRALNEVYPLFRVLAFADGIPPLTAYVEMCRLLGQLALFGESRRSPEVPLYDHDNLSRCFYTVRRYLDGLFDRILEPQYKVRPFEGAGMRMQVPLEPAWLETAWRLFVGVRSPLSPEECVNLVTKTAQLDMKIGSSSTVDLIFQRGLAGLNFVHTPQPPRALPSSPGLIYFEVNREAQQSEWQNIQKTLTLAIRLNENRVEGSIEGQQILRIRVGAQTVTLQFALYVVRAVD
jgi:type VI secretion system protein ImpJ